MPIYAFEHSCGWHDVLRRTINERVLPACPNCGQQVELHPLITKEHHARTIIPSVSNRIYNHGQGRWDSGLGRWVHSREEHRQIMKEQGVAELDTSYDAFMASLETTPEPPAPSLEHIKDLWDQEEAEYNKGKRPKEPQIPEKFKLIGE